MDDNSAQNKLDTLRKLHWNLRWKPKGRQHYSEGEVVQIVVFHEGNTITVQGVTGQDRTRYTINIEQFADMFEVIF